MDQDDQLHFGPFRLDVTLGRLWRGDQEIKLRPKSLAVLRHLLGRPGQLVTKEELLETVWARTHVTRTVMKVCVRELRAALGDRAVTSAFIETVGRQGYRFVAEVRGDRLPVGATRRVPSRLHGTIGLVGRQAALDRLERSLARAREGERQVVFVTGEAGIGKTSLLDAFVARISSSADLSLSLAQGQCVEHHGAGEAYLPVLDALGRLCRGSGAEEVVAQLHRHAPMWLAQMPALLDAQARERLSRELVGATRERMLREMAELLEALASGRTLVVWLDDLQWSDAATVELLGSLARRREPARLMLVGSYRPVDVDSGQHLLGRVKRELLVRRQCAELPLELLDEGDVQAYLRARLPGIDDQAELDRELARVVHRRTDGNPLFMVNLIDYLLDGGLLSSSEQGWQATRGLEAVAREVPAGLRELIAQELESLSPTQRTILVAASVVGQEFAAATVGAAIELDEARIESCCEDLAERRQLVRRSGVEEAPDGSRTARYRFGHALYREVLYEHAGPLRRARLHERIARHLEVVCGSRLREMAVELALHFEEGGVPAKAVRYHRYAGENAIGRHAHHEAAAHLRRGLEMLPRLPDARERAQQELRLQIALGTALLTIDGLADPEVGRAYGRARELCRDAGANPRLFTVLWGLWAFYLARAEFPAARELAERRLELAEQSGDPALLALAHLTVGTTLFYLGAFGAALHHFEQSIAFYDPERYRAAAYLDDLDPGVTARAYAAWALWLCGALDRARGRNEDALALARRLAHPHTEALALSFSAWFRQLSRERAAVAPEAEAALAFARQHGFAQWLASGRMLQGWARAEQGEFREGIAQAQQVLELQRANGARLSSTYWLSLLADAQARAGDHAGALATLAGALDEAERSGERYFEAELHRMKGEVLCSRATRRPGTSAAGASAWQDAAGECFHKAIEIARGQGALLLELRAALSLARLRRERRGPRRRPLADAYGRFTEGFDTPDLREAKALLDRRRRAEHRA